MWKIAYMCLIHPWRGGALYAPLILQYIQKRVVTTHQRVGKLQLRKCQSLPKSCGVFPTWVNVSHQGHSPKVCCMGDRSERCWRYPVPEFFSDTTTSLPSDLHASGPQCGRRSINLYHDSPHNPLNAACREKCVILHKWLFNRKKRLSNSCPVPKRHL